MNMEPRNNDMLKEILLFLAIVVATAIAVN